MLIFGEYTVEQYAAIHVSCPEAMDVYRYMKTRAPELSRRFRNKIDWKNFHPTTYASNHRLMVARHKGRIIGVHLSRLSRSVFDFDLRIAYQDLLFAEPGTRGAKLLLDDFIDFGRRHADHVIAAISEGTNIKEESMCKLGFEPMETLYRLEV